eukprot:3097257-Pleurochrysis_carterae.AAC.4
MAQGMSSSTSIDAKKTVVTEKVTRNNADEHSHVQPHTCAASASCIRAHARTRSGVGTRMHERIYTQHAFICKRKRSNTSITARSTENFCKPIVQFRALSDSQHAIKSASVYSSACPRCFAPGVSMRLISWSFHTNVVAAA